MYVDSCSRVPSIVLVQNNNFLGEARRNDAETFLEWPNAHVGDTAIRAILGIALLANRIFEI